MKEEVKLKRKVSAIVAVALAMMVSFFAALDSYGDSSNELLKDYDVDIIVVAEAYDAVVEENFEVEMVETDLKVIKIFDAQDQLIKEVSVTLDGVIENNETQRLLNRAEYLSGYNNTEVYRLLN